MLDKLSNQSYTSITIFPTNHIWASHRDQHKFFVAIEQSSVAYEAMRRKQMKVYIWFVFAFVHDFVAIMRNI